MDLHKQDFAEVQLRDAVFQMHAIHFLMIILNKKRIENIQHVILFPSFTCRPNPLHEFLCELDSQRLFLVLELLGRFRFVYLSWTVLWFVYIGGLLIDSVYKLFLFCLWFWRDLIEKFYSLGQGRSVSYRIICRPRRRVKKMNIPLSLKW